MAFCLTARVYLNMQKYGLFCSLIISVICTCTLVTNVLCSSVISPCGRCIIVTASVKILEPLHKFMLRMELLSQR